MTWWPRRRAQPALFHPSPATPFTNSLAAMIAAGAGWSVILPAVREWELANCGRRLSQPVVTAPPASAKMSTPRKGGQRRTKPEDKKRKRWRQQKRNQRARLRLVTRDGGAA